jgi:hypothetical protein
LRQATGNSDSEDQKPAALLPAIRCERKTPLEIGDPYATEMHISRNIKRPYRLGSKTTTKMTKILITRHQKSKFGREHKLALMMMQKKQVLLKNTI